MEAAVASGNCLKLLQLTGATGSKKSGVSETICEDDRMPIASIYRHGRWVGFSERQFNWPAAPAASIRLSYPPWLVATAPLDEVEVRKELQLLKRYISTDQDDLPPALFKGGVDFLNEEPTTLFAKVWQLKRVPTSWNE